MKQEIKHDIARKEQDTSGRAGCIMILAGVIAGLVWAFVKMTSEVSDYDVVAHLVFWYYAIPGSVVGLGLGILGGMIIEREKFQVHLGTVIAMMIVAAILVGVNCVNWHHGDSTLSWHIDYGFPYTFVGGHIVADREFYWTSFVFDVCFAIVAVFATSRFIEGWFLRPRPDPKGSV